jgi:hypothetical protein
LNMIRRIRMLQACWPNSTTKTSHSIWLIGPCLETRNEAFVALQSPVLLEADSIWF